MNLAEKGAENKAHVNTCMHTAAVKHKRPAAETRRGGVHTYIYI